MNRSDLITGFILAIHLWCMGMATFAPFYAIGAEIREASGKHITGRIGRRMLTIGILSLLVGTIVGLIYGFLLFDKPLADALARLTSRIWFGVAEWGISLGVLAIVRYWWGRRSQCGKVERGFRVFLLFFAATNLAYHFPVLFEILSQLKLEAGASSEPLSSAAFRAWVVKPVVLSQVIHFLTASVIIGGAHLILIADNWHTHETIYDSQRHKRLGAHLIWIPAAIQIFVGTWVTINLTSESQLKITGLLNLTGITFAGSVLVSLLLIPHALSLAMRDTVRNDGSRLAIHVGIVILLMAILARVAT